MVAPLIEDDEDLVTLLVSSPERVSASRLKELSDRFLADAAQQDAAAFKRVVLNAEGLGFAVAGLAHDITAPPASSQATSSIPVAFDSPEGKLHLDATMALLLCSRHQAVEVTLGALVTATATQDIAPFLGTTALLEKVLHYYFCQKLARLTAIGELLRLEQQEEDDGPSITSTIAETLNALDGQVRVGPANLPRGLFRILLAKTMIQQATFHIDQLLPAKPLCKASNSDEHHTAWQHLNTILLHIQQAFYARERILAMQVLGGLLYNRMSVYRHDLIVLLLAFQANDSWFTSSPDIPAELPRLAGIIGVESMGLWRLVEDNWVAEHPLMEGLFDPQQEDAVVRELQHIQGLLENNLVLIPARKAVHGYAEVPDSLTVLAYGLLLKVAHAAILWTSEGANSGSHWQSFSDEGMRLCQKSNGCGSFEYFYAVMVSLVPSAFARQAKHGGLQGALDGQDLQVEDLGSTCLTFASIGRELLNSAIVAFEDTLLTLGHDGVCENVGMMCNLANVVHQNSPALCQRFWLEWETMYLVEPLERHVPACRLLDIAYQLANKSQYADSLQGLAPLLSMVSAIVYDAKSTEMVLTRILPRGLLQKAIYLCASASVSLDQQHSVLQSVMALSRTGNSNCRTHLRKILQEDPSGNCSLNYPKMLFSSARDEIGAENVLLILNTLVTEAPERWVLESSLHALQWDSVLTDACLDNSRLPKAFASFFGSVAERIQNVLCSTLIRVNEKIAFITGIDKATRVCLAILSSRLSTPGGRAVRSLYDVESAYHVLKCLTSVLVFMRPSFTSDQMEIIESVNALRSTFISHVARKNGLCEALLHFTVFPITLSLASELHDFLQETATLEAAMSAAGGRPVFVGLSRNTAASTPTQFLFEMVEKFQFKFEGTNAKGWLSNDDLPVVLQAARQAIRFLTWWALVVEDMVIDNDDTDMLCLSPYQALSHPSVLPAVCRTRREMLATWSAVAPPILSLLMCYAFQSEVDDLAIVAVDFLHLCLVHSKRQSGTSLHNESLFRILSRSGSFKRLTIKLASDMLPAALWSGENEGHCDEQLMFGLLHVLSTCADFSASMAISMLDTSQADIFAALSGVVVGVTKDMEQHNDAGRCSSSLVHNIKVGCHCLELILSLARQTGSLDWKEVSSRRVEVMKSSSVYKEQLLLQLSGFLFRTDESQLSSEPIFDAFLALVLEFLSTEISLAMSSVDSDDNARLLKVLELVVADRFVSVLDYQTRLKRFSGYSSACFNFDALLTTLTESSITFERLIPLLTTTSRLDGDLWSECEFSVFARAPNYFTANGNESLALAVVARHLGELEVARRGFVSECRRVRSWGIFCDRLMSFSLMMKSTNKQMSFLDPGITSEGATCCACALLKHLKVLEHADRKTPELMTEGLAMAGPLAACLLRLLESVGCNDEAWITILELIGHCFAALSVVQVLKLDLAASLLSAGAALFSLRPSFESRNGIGERAKTAELKLISACCNFLREIEPLSSSVGAHQRSTCVRTSISLLLTAVSSFPPMPGTRADERHVAEALDIFADCNVIETICRHATSIISLATPRSNLTLKNESDSGVVVSCLELLATLVSFNNSVALSRQIESHVSGLVSLIATQVQHFNSRQGGHVKASLEIDGAIRIQHRACLRFIETALRTTLNSPVRVQRIQSTYAVLAVNYLVATQQWIRQCLEQCSAIPTFCLTLQGLQEAHSILAISGHLCAEETRDDFTRASHDLFHFFVCQAKDIIVTLSSFLGASAAARERFAAIDVDTTDSSDEARGETSLAIRLLKSGAPNAKHEAIRFSHFRYEHYSAVTEEEKSNSERFSGNLRQSREIEAVPQSLSSLEYKCRSTVSCRFAFELERAVAECLLSACSILWSTHPASVAMVKFTEMEATRLDAFSLVQVGSYIAFRQARVPRSDRTAAREDAEVSVGRVILADTFNHMWHVRVSGSSEGDAIVKQSELAGIEDVARWRSVFAYRPAPDTANELEASLGSASIGHLVLALRWCHNISRIDDGSSESALFLGRLSEVLARFIAKELAIHKKIGSQLANKTDIAAAIASQLFDLFGIEQTGGMHLSSDRCIGDLLSADAWHSVRDELYREIAPMDSSYVK